MKIKYVYIGLLLLCSLISYHSGRLSKQYNWNEVSTASATTVAVVTPAPKQQKLIVENCEPAAYFVRNDQSQKESTESDEKVELLGDFSELSESAQHDAQAISSGFAKTEFTQQAPIENLSTKPSLEVAKATIDKLPPHIINSHLQRYFKLEDLDLIDDQTQFAQKLAQEYLDENPERLEEPSYPSTIHFSLSKNFYESPVTDFLFTRETKKTSIYAHLRMSPSVVNNSHIFVKWMNLSTDKVMLFNKKRISLGSNQNWVSLKPDKGWKPGVYKVKLYQFDSSLTPIVEGQYYVYEQE